MIWIANTPCKPWGTGLNHGAQVQPWLPSLVDKTFDTILVDGT